MKKLWMIFKNFKQVCPRCHGMGTIELANGETKECPVCKGKGMV